MANVFTQGPLPAVLRTFLLSAIDIMRDAANPQSNIMHPMPDGHGNLPSRSLENPMVLPVLVLFLFGAEIFFASVLTFETGSCR